MNHSQHHAQSMGSVAAIRQGVILLALWMTLAVGPWMQHATASELVLAEGGRSNFQIVLPDESVTIQVAGSLRQTARLMQAAFKANGVDIEIVAESARDAERFGIFLGNTRFAKRQGADVEGLQGWSYLHKAADGHLIIAGHDHATPARFLPEQQRFAFCDRIATAKGVVDFLHQYVGVRFLYPEMPPRQQLNQGQSIDLLASAAIEYLRIARIAVPADLDVKWTPPLEYNFSWPTWSSFYDLAMNRFPLVDAMITGHTWHRAIPPENHAERHPEYFALIDGKRYTTGTQAHAQYCIGNPQVRELMYIDLKKYFDAGFQIADLGQPDSFRSCECQDCFDLYGTGSDWNEKIWQLHREIAQRVYESHPGRIVVITSYIQTAQPPKSFSSFPPNVRIMVGIHQNEDGDSLQAWREFPVPQGFASYVYFWTSNLTSRYLPMRTPLFIEKQVGQFVKDNIRSIFRDNPGMAYGSEGPVYYTMGRMFQDAENIEGKDAFHEFNEAAFGKAAPAMVRFYDQLYHSIEIYARFLGTGNSFLAYRNIYGRGRKALTNPFPMLGFLYPPDLMASMNEALSRAEGMANTDKVKARLALVRREFDYIHNLSKVIHLYQAYLVLPDRASRDRLLDALEARNNLISAYYDTQGNVTALPGWSQTLFPPSGHDAAHLRLAYDLYQEPFRNTFLNWDVAAVRESPLPSSNRIFVRSTDQPVTLDSQLWSSHAPQPLMRTDGAQMQHETDVQLTSDAQNLYVRWDALMPLVALKHWPEREKIEVYIAPDGGNLTYRFTVSPTNEKRSEAVRGAVTDLLDARYGQFDSGWSGEWDYTMKLDTNLGRWKALLRIPFKTLGATAASGNGDWRINIVRHSGVDADTTEHSSWAASTGQLLPHDPAEYPAMVFEDVVASHPMAIWRKKYYAHTFELPREWQDIPLQTRVTGLDDWQLRVDPLEKGKEERWFDPASFDAARWVHMTVPAFWSENEEVGEYQGVAWYHTTFKLPASAAEATVRLCFASVDEQASVYVNGHLVGEHTQASTGLKFDQLWEKPFIVEVPQDILGKQDVHTLVVRVDNAQGGGGIWRPVIGHIAAQP